MADLIFTASTEVITATGTNAVINAERIVTCTTEVVALTEAVADIYRSFSGSIAQTLPSVTQSATGETDFFTLYDTAIAGGNIVLGVEGTITDIAIAGDALLAIVAANLAETALASGDPTFEVVIHLHETATAASELGPVAVTTLFTPKGAEASSEIEISFSDTLVSVVNASNTLETIISESLHETAQVREELIQAAVLNEILVSTAVASNEIDQFTGYQLTETANASSSIVDYAAVTETLVETADALGSVVGSVTMFEELLSSVDASSLITFEGSVANNALHETANAYGYPIAKDFAAVAWVMNTETGGLATYDNFQFNSIAAYNGALYGTSADGVYKLTGEDDEGRDIDALVKTGFLDFEQQQTKRISDIFIGCTGGPLEFDIETYDGPQEVYTYTVEEREIAAPRNTRIKSGRGLSSRYWRFAYRNVDGADFQVYDVTAEVATSKRRL